MRPGRVARLEAGWPGPKLNAAAGAIKITFELGGRNLNSRSRASGCETRAGPFRPEQVSAGELDVRAGRQWAPWQTSGAH